MQMKETSKMYLKKAVDAKKAAEARTKTVEDELGESKALTNSLQDRIAEIQSQVLPPLLCMLSSL